jgi:hypothetical protein
MTPGELALIVGRPPQWATHVVVATLGTKVTWDWVGAHGDLPLGDASPDERQQFDATATAIGLILNHASDAPRGMWARGRIDLYRLDTGEVIHTMEAK